MENKNTCIFPVTESISTPTEMKQTTTGGTTKREELVFRLASSLLENPNVKIENIDARQVIDFADRLFDVMEGKI